MEEARVTVKLEPYALSAPSAFIGLLQTAGIHPRLRMDAVRTSRILEEVLVHASRRWHATLLQLHGPVIEVMRPSPEGDFACDPCITIGELCEGADLGSDNILRLQYCVRTGEERKPSPPASEASVSVYGCSAPPHLPDHDDEATEACGAFGSETGARGASKRARPCDTAPTLSIPSSPPPGEAAALDEASALLLVPDEDLEARVAAVRSTCLAEVDRAVRQRIAPALDAFLNDQIDERELSQCRQAMRHVVATEHCEYTNLECAHAAYRAALTAQATARSALESALLRLESAAAGQADGSAGRGSGGGGGGASVRGAYVSSLASPSPPPPWWGGGPAASGSFGVVAPMPGGVPGGAMAPERKHSDRGACGGLRSLNQQL